MGGARGRRTPAPGGRRTTWWSEPQWRSILEPLRLPEETRGAQVIEAVAERLEALVREGRLFPGDRLPPERYLATELGVSRGSVREALQELELKGLVERVQGRGTIVTDVERHELTERLIGHLDSEDRSWAEVMDFREAIEVPIAARAARAATRVDVRRLEEMLRSMQRVRSGERYAELDARFHQTVAEATHNRLLIAVVEITSRWSALTRRSVLQGPRRREASMRGHRALLEAIRRHDPEAAAGAMQQHVHDIVRELERQSPRPPVPRAAGR